MTSEQIEKLKSLVEEKIHSVDCKSPEFSERVKITNRLNELKLERKRLNKEIKEYKKAIIAEKQRLERSFHGVSVSLPDFLYESYGEIKIGYHGDSVVTDEWRAWLEGYAR